MFQASLEGVILIPRPVQQRKQNQKGAARHGVGQRNKKAAVEPEGLAWSGGGRSGRTIAPLKNSETSVLLECGELGILPGNKTGGLHRGQVIVRPTDLSTVHYH